ncbi:copper amine oxidase N-terminal domain-containing protein [Paenibacillus profundus]|uniref:Copper amine oxidase N-terminal domain-containing protein n=1 Tax=Paenibacillus profundus TaxID=1173085 RepID=A0ABS8YC18_9BACL|nr:MULTISPECIES: stalk domain-containing protein [Paenibacillus]MCE5167880.1 copper amine oxidase N-terminal domain-containing protein [Paenibacillus profundus]
MNCRRIAAFVLLGSILGGAYASAQSDPSSTSLQAAAPAEKIQVILNGSTVQEGGVMLEGRAYLSVRQISDALLAFVTWDEANKKVVIEKPNVDLLLFKDNTPFGKVETGKTSFTALAQVDSLKTSVDKIKLTITDPKGNTTQIQEDEVKTDEDNFWFRTSEFKYDFKAKGDYTISCYLRQKNGEFTLLSQKTVSAI